MIRKKKLSNYFLSGTGEKLVINPSPTDPYKVGGTCYGFDNFPDGTLLIIDKKKIAEDNIILDHMHSDYKELLNAYDAGIPVIDWWWIDENRPYSECFYGKIDNKTITGTITGQDGNYLFLDEKKYYVIWCNTKKKVRPIHPSPGYRLHEIPAYYYNGSYMGFRYVRPILFIE